MNKVTIMLEGFEGISETQGKKLVGGFSASFSAVSKSAVADDAAANNCRGGNCTTGCGGNTGCNTVANCKCTPTIN